MPRIRASLTAVAYEDGVYEFEAANMEEAEDRVDKSIGEVDWEFREFKEVVVDWIEEIK